MNWVSPQSIVYFSKWTKQGKISVMRVKWNSQVLLLSNVSGHSVSNELFWGLASIHYSSSWHSMMMRLITLPLFSIIQHIKLEWTYWIDISAFQIRMGDPISHLHRWEGMIYGTLLALNEFIYYGCVDAAPRLFTAAFHPRCSCCNSNPSSRISQEVKNTAHSQWLTLCVLSLELFRDEDIALHRGSANFPLVAIMLPWLNTSSTFPLFFGWWTVRVIRGPCLGMCTPNKDV